MAQIQKLWVNKYQPNNFYLAEASLLATTIFQMKGLAWNCNFEFCLQNAL